METEAEPFHQPFKANPIQDHNIYRESLKHSGSSKVIGRWRRMRELRHAKDWGHAHPDRRTPASFVRLEIVDAATQSEAHAGVRKTRDRIILLEHLFDHFLIHIAKIH